MNPFVQNIRLEVTKYVETRNVAFDGMSVDEFYAVKNQSITRTFFGERVEKTSIYHVKGDMELLFGSGMTSAGRDVLYYLQRILKKDMDWVPLNRTDACEKMHCARGTLFNGLKQLAAAGLIAPKGTRELWVNPMYIFNGNRIEYFQNLEANDAKLNVKFTQLIRPKL